MNQSLQSFLKNNFGIYSVLSVLSLIIYHNALKCGFVFDDVSAIIENEDLRPSISWSKLLEHDFWGTPMSEERSHKSYRPLTVATFKLNYFFNDLNPFPYHAVNIVIHAIVCCLNYRLCVLVTDVCSQHDTVETNTEPKIIPQKLKVSKRKKLQKKIYQEDLLKPLNKDDQTNLAISFVAALLFTVHPVHTEAVTGVVGRAELLSALFYLLAMITYTSISFKNNFLSSIFCLLAVACKEQGITILALCVIYDVFIAHKLSVFEFITMKKQSSLTVLLRCLLFVLTVMLILLWRLTVMTTMPAFSKYDNPAAFESFPTKQLTFNYLLVVNALLLLCPINLLCDWSMGTVPLVEDVMDSRNMLTLLFWIAMLALAYKSFAGKSSTDKLILFGSTLLVVSFLPASNFFFSVGFVVAERVLYVPSMGFCLLVATAMVKLWKISHLKPLVACFLFVTVVCHSLKTITRNEDWLNDYTLFNSGLKVTSYNAKVWNNVGHYFEKRNDFQQALDYFQQVIDTHESTYWYITVSSSFAQLDGVEFKVSDVVKIKPFKFKPLNITLRDPTELLLNSEHDFSTEKKVLEWATVKHHRSSIKRPKKTVNAEMRLELESKLRSFVNTQKQNDVNSLTNGIPENKTSETNPQDVAMNSATTISTPQSSRVFLPSDQMNTSPHTISPLSNSSRSSPSENVVTSYETPPPIPPRRSGASVSADQRPPVPLPHTSYPAFTTNSDTLPQISVVNTPTVSISNTQPYSQFQQQHFQNYSLNNPFLSDLKDDEILQPQPANASISSSQNPVEIDNAKIWVDFENKDLDPFTNLELKSLDDMKELSRVLESNSQMSGTNSPYANGPTATATPVMIGYPNLNTPIAQPPSTTPYNFVNLSGT